MRKSREELIKNPYVIFGFVFIGSEVLITIIDAALMHRNDLGKFFSPLDYWNNGLSFPANLNGWVESAWPASVIAVVVVTLWMACQKKRSIYFPAWLAASGVAIVSFIVGTYPSYLDKMDPLLDSAWPQLATAVAPMSIVFGLVYLFIRFRLLPDCTKRNHFPSE